MAFGVFYSDTKFNLKLYCVFGHTLASTSALHSDETIWTFFPLLGLCLAVIVSVPNRGAKSEGHGGRPHWSASKTMRGTCVRCLSKWPYAQQAHARLPLACVFATVAYSPFVRCVRYWLLWPEFFASLGLTSLTGERSWYVLVRAYLVHSTGLSQQGEPDHFPSKAIY